VNGVGIGAVADQNGLAIVLGSNVAGHFTQDGSTISNTNTFTFGDIDNATGTATMIGCMVAQQFQEADAAAVRDLTHSELSGLN
jgi:hypothetical protein